jgi:hypothetical protein
MPNGNESLDVLLRTLRTARERLEGAEAARRLKTGAVARLQSQVAPTATVCRDRAWVELPRRDIVVGDVVRLAAGDLVRYRARHGVRRHCRPPGGTPGG